MEIVAGPSLAFYGAIAAGVIVVVWFFLRRRRSH
jgi:hypothetical protein